MAEDPRAVEDAVRLAIAAFVSSPEATEDELGAILRRAGLSAEGARRMVVLLPLAFGRVMMKDVAFPPEFETYDRKGAFPLAADRVFACATRLAREEGTRTWFQAIALGSAEIRVINDALKAGSRLENLVFSRPRLDLDPEPATLPPSPWWRWSRPPDVPTLWCADEWVDTSSFLARFLERHGVAVGPAAGGVVPLTGGGTWEARVFPGKVTDELCSVQVDIRVTAPALGARTLVESAAWMGSTHREAVGRVLERLCQGSLHVLLAAVVGHDKESEQVEWEAWGDAAQGAWRACLGALQFGMGPAFEVPFGAVLDAVRDRFLAARLPREPHWIRIYRAGALPAGAVDEVLLDNDPWPEGAELLAGWSWPAREEPWSIRCFLVVVPDEPTS